MIEILKKGVYCSVQDLGRSAGLQFGVPISGAMDRVSYNRANMILGNVSGCAALECALVGPEIRFQESTVIAISGADMSPALNGNPVPMLHPLPVSKGDILKLGPARTGCRTYIGFRGGLLSEKVLGSRSQYEGITSKPFLERGDLVQFESSEFEFSPSKSRIKIDKTGFLSSEIMVLEGPEFSAMKGDQASSLLSMVCTISPLNNRMAYQLEETVENDIDPIITSPVLPGTVQLTPSGRLIILMRDAQTTGGYPRVLQLTTDAIDILAQKRTGDKIGFKIKSKG